MVSLKLFSLVLLPNNYITILNKCLIHSNRAAVCLIKRPPNRYTRMFPTRIVFKDGSTIITRYEVPREIIKMPMCIEDCLTDQERAEWQNRRKKRDVIKVKKDDNDVEFDRMKYLKTMMTGKQQMPSQKK